MPEVDLSLVANNQQYISSVKEAQQTYQSFNDTVKKGEKEQEGLINSTVEAIDQYEKKRKASWKTEDIEKYNKKIAEAKQTLDEYNKLGTKTQEKQESGWKKLTGTFSGVGSMLLKVAGAAGIAFSAFEFGKKVIASTDTLADKFEATMGGLNATIGFVARSIANWDFSNFTEGFKNAYEEGKRYTQMLDDLEDRMRSLQISSSNNRLEFINLMTAFRDQTKSVKERIAIGEEMVMKSKSNTDKEKRLSDDKFQNELTNVERLATANQQLSEADHRRNEDNIKFFIQNYNNISEAVKLGYEDVRALGTEYNDMISTRANLMKLEKDADRQRYGSLAGAVNQTKDYKKEIEDLTKKIDSASDHQKYWAGIMKIMGNITDEQRKKLVQSWVDVINTEASGRQEIIRTEGQLSGFRQSEREKEQKRIEEANKKRLEQQAEYQKLALELLKRYEKSILDEKTGKEKILAEEKIANDEITQMRSKMSMLGAITKDQEAMIQNLRTNIHQATVKQIKEIDDKELNDKKEFNKKSLDASEQLELEVADLTEAGEIAKLDIQLKYAAERVKLLNAEGTAESQMQAAQLQNVIDSMHKKKQTLLDEKNKFTIYKLLGIDTSTEQGQKEADMVDEAAAQMKDAIQTVMDAEIQAAELHTELIDKKIGKKEDELEEEKKLAEEGLANSVDAKKRELAQLNAEKKKALEEERRLKQQQITIDTIMQTSKLALSAVELFESQAPKGIPGVIIAAGLIASMFGIIAGARAKAKALEAETQMGEGGYIDEYGVIKGKKHSQGGERLLDKISVEKDEGISVFSAQATKYYGQYLPKWTSQINSMQIPFDTIKPSLNQSNTYNLETKKMEKKLDSINEGLRLLNNNIVNQSGTAYNGKRRVQKLSKNHTRVILN